jgi:hypothetical protein
MDQETKKVVIGAGVIVAVLFGLYGCGGDRGYYCVQMERGGCVEYEPAS